MFNIIFVFVSADDTNLFCSHSNIKILFGNANNELKIAPQWFQATKLFMNKVITKFTLFQRSHHRDNVLFQLPNPKIKEYGININKFS